MARSIEKVRKDTVNNIIVAFDPEIVNEGSAFELDSNQIVPAESFKTGLGKFEANLLKLVSNEENEIYPSNDDSLQDEIFEINGDGDLTPKN